MSLGLKEQENSIIFSDKITPRREKLVANLTNKFFRNASQKRYGTSLLCVKVWLLIDTGISTFVKKNLHFPTKRFRFCWRHTSHISKSSKLVNNNHFGENA